MKDKNLPCFSIVMPTWNSERFIREALDSLVAQNYELLELVIIDGGSEDKTLEIIEEYTQLEKKVFTGKDQGMNHAVNKGILAATGDFCLWLPSDDLLNKGSLQAVADRLVEKQELDLLYGDAGQIDENGELIKLHGAVPYDKSRLLHRRCYFPCQSTFFRRSCISLTGLLDTTLIWNGDWDLWKRFATNDHVLNIEFLDKRLGDWRIYRDTISYRGGSKELYRKSLETIRNTRKYSAYFITNIEVRLWTYLLVGFFRLRKPLRALKNLIQSK